MFSGILSKQMFGVLGIHKVYNYTGRFLLKKNGTRYQKGLGATFNFPETFSLFSFDYFHIVPVV